MQPDQHSQSTYKTIQPTNVVRIMRDVREEEAAHEGRGRSEREGEQRRGACCRRTRSNFRNHSLIYHLVSVHSADESAELGSQ
jgi:hypothetical protein